jgi:hypothetical protein
VCRDAVSRPDGAKLKEEALLAVRFLPLIGAAGWPEQEHAP